jgi:uncharacterized MAPEG superfamily protein
MTTPDWMLLAFAMWTLLLLLVTVGIYRWSRIFSGRVAIRDFPADAGGGEEWYKRATRAHANCIENLPVFAAIVFALHVSHAASPLVDALSVAILLARTVQSTVHVCFVHTNTIASLRFGFYFVQFIGFVWLAGYVVVAQSAL